MGLKIIKVSSTSIIVNLIKDAIESFFAFCFSYDAIQFQRAENIKKSNTVCSLLSLPLLVKFINSQEIMLYRLKDGCRRM